MTTDLLATIFKPLLTFAPWIMVNLIFFAFLISNSKKIKGKFYSGLFYSSCTLVFVSNLFQCFIQYSLTNYGMGETRYLYHLGGFTYPASLLFSMGVISVLIEERVSLSFKESVWRLFFLSMFTGGFYVVYWYLKRNIQFTKSTTAKVAYVLLCYFFYMYFSLLISFDNYKDLIVYNSLLGLILIMSIYVGILVTITISIFTIRNGIRREGMECDPIATFFFGPLYLQYKINQLDDLRARRTEYGLPPEQVTE